MLYNPRTDITLPENIKRILDLLREQKQNKKKADFNKSLDILKKEIKLHNGQIKQQIKKILEDNNLQYCCAHCGELQSKRPKLVYLREIDRYALSHDKPHHTTKKLMSLCLKCYENIITSLEKEVSDTYTYYAKKDYTYHIFPILQITPDSKTLHLEHHPEIDHIVLDKELENIDLDNANEKTIIEFKKDVKILIRTFQILNIQTIVELLRKKSIEFPMSIRLEHGGNSVKLKKCYKI